MYCIRPIDDGQPVDVLIAFPQGLLETLTEAAPPGMSGSNEVVFTFSIVARQLPSTFPEMSDGRSKLFLIDGLYLPHRIVLSVTLGNY